MQLSLKDLSALGRPLLLLALIAGLVAGGIVFAERLVKRAKADLASAESDLVQARERVKRSGDERDTIKQYVGSYRELEQRGVLGEEQRLGWVDALRAANNRAQLYGVEYEVSAQQPFAFSTEAEAGKLPVQQSIMKLRIGLLHEEDLLSFFQALAKQNVGVFSVNQCSLQRLVPEVVHPSNSPTLRAECDVGWITIPKATPAEGNS